MRIRPMNRLFDPGDEQPSFPGMNDRPQYPGASTVSPWENAPWNPNGGKTLHQLLSDVQSVHPGAQITQDTYGRNVIEVQHPVSQFSAGAPAISHIHLDEQTGALSVNPRNNPSGGFFIEDRLKSFSGLPEAPQGGWGSSQQFREAAYGAGALETKGDILKSYLQNPTTPLNIQAQRDKFSYNPYDQMALSPQARVRLATSLALPSMVQTPEGTSRPAQSQDYFNFLQSTGLSSSYGVKSGTSTAIDLQAYESANYLTNALGEHDAKAVKRDTNAGNRESRSWFSSPDLSGAVEPMTAPFRYAGSPEANQGYKQNVLLTMHQSVTQEGQAWIKPGAGFLRTEWAREISSPNGAPQTGIYGNAPGSIGSLDDLRRMTGKDFSSHQSVSIDAVNDIGNGRYGITGGAYIPRAGTSSKFYGKALMAVAGEESGLVPRGIDMVMGAPGPEDMMKFGEKALAATYDSTDQFNRLMKGYAVGYNKLGKNDQAWVEQNAPWLMNAEGAGSVSSVAKFNKMYDGSGVVGGENAPIFAGLTRAFAASRMQTQTWNDISIPGEQYERNKNVMIDGVPMYQNAELVSGSGKSAVYNVGTVTDKVFAATTMERFQPEYTNNRSTIGHESLDRYARYRPEAYQYMTDLDKMGATTNAARDIVTAVRANYQGPVGQQALASLNNIMGVLPGKERSALNANGERGPLNLDTLGIDYNQLYSNAQESAGEGATTDAINEHFLRNVAGVTGNAALNAGGIILPSVQAALSTYTMNAQTGQAVNNLGSNMVKTLLAQANYNEVSRLGGGEDALNVRNTSAYSTLQAAAGMMEDERDPNGNVIRSAKSFIDRATGIEVPAITAPAIASNYLAANQAAIPQSELFRLTGARSREEQAQVLGMASQGQLTGLLRMFPESDVTTQAIQPSIVTNEQINALYGRQVLSGENPYHIGATAAEALAKDFDADWGGISVLGSFQGEGENRRWIQANTSPDTAEFISQRAQENLGREMAKQDETAARDPGNYLKQMMNVAWKSTAKLGAGYMETLQAKTLMGPMYNQLNRGIARTVEAVSDIVNIGKGALGRVQRSVAGVAQFGYQSAIDMNAQGDPNLTRLVDMFKTLNFEHSHGVGSGAGYMDSGTGKYVSFQDRSGGSNPISLKNDMAAQVMSTVANIGLTREGLDMSKEKDQAKFAERMDVYKNQMARNLANSMLPYNATDEQRATAEQMLREHGEAFERGENPEFNTSKFARLAGNDSQLEWLVGNQNKPLESISPVASALAGTMQMRMEDKNPGRAAGATTGRMKELGQIRRGTAAFFDEQYNATTAEDFFKSVGMQNKSVTPFTQSIMADVGGVGNGQGAFDAIKHLDPRITAGGAGGGQPPIVPPGIAAPSPEPEPEGNRYSGSEEPTGMFDHSTYDDQADTYSPAPALSAPTGMKVAQATEMAPAEMRANPSSGVAGRVVQQNIYNLNAVSTAQVRQAKLQYGKYQSILEGLENRPEGESVGAAISRMGGARNFLKMQRQLNSVATTSEKRAQMGALYRDNPEANAALAIFSREDVGDQAYRAAFGNGAALASDIGSRSEPFLDEIVSQSLQDTEMAKGGRLSPEAMQAAQQAISHIGSVSGDLGWLAAEGSKGSISPASMQQVRGVAGSHATISKAVSRLRSIGTNRTLTSEEKELLSSGESALGTEGLSAVADLNVAYKQGQISIDKAAGRVSPETSQNRLKNIGDAAEHIESLSHTLGKLSESVQGVDKVSKEHMETINKTAKAIETVISGNEALGKIANRPLTAEEAEAKARSSALIKEHGEDFNNIISARNAGRYGSLGIAGPELSDQEKQAQLMSALFTGGRSGARMRANLSDDIWSQGIETPFGQITDRGTLETLGSASRVASHAQSGIWAMRQLQRTIIQPLEQEAQVYMQAQVGNTQSLMGAGLINYGQMMGTTSGNILRMQAQQQQFQIAEGQQVYNSYAGLFGSMSGQVAGRNAGMLSAISSPMIGGAVVGAQLGEILGPMGALIGGGIGLGAGLMAWGAGASQDVNGIAGFESNRRRNGGVDLAGGVSSMLSAIFHPDLYKQAQNLGNAQSMAGAYINGEQNAIVGTGNVSVAGMGTSLSSNQAVNQLMQTYGLDRATAESAMQGQYKNRAVSQYGLTEQQANDIYAFQRQYLGNQSINSAQFQAFQQMAGAGAISILQVQALAAAGGMNATSPEGINAAQDTLTTYLQGVGFTGGNVVNASNFISQNQQLMSAVSSAARMSGMARSPLAQFQYGFNYLANNQYANDPARMNMQASADIAGMGRIQQNSALGAAFNTAFGTSFGVSMNLNDMATAQNQLNQAAPAYGMAQQFAMYGMNVNRAGQVMGTLAGIQDPAQAAQYMAAAQGDRLAQTQLARSGKLPSGYELMDLNTGSMPYQYGVRPDQAVMVAQYARSTGQQGALLNAMGTDWQGGIVGLQAQSHDIQQAQFNQQYAYQVAQMNISNQTQTGGATQLNAQGFAVGGDNLRGLAALFRQNGMAFNPGNGMGQWQLEDAQTQLSRQQQQFSLGQAQQSYGISVGQFNLAGQQFQEQHALQQAQFNYNTQFHQQSMQISRGRQVTQEGWQEQDLAFGAARNQLEYGWQMQDADRNIRYARGRERLDLMRQKSRATIEHALDVQQEGRQESRLHVQEGWSATDFKRQEANFEQTKKFQQEQMDMQKKYFDEGRVFDQQRLDMQKQANDKQAQWMNQSFQLEDQGRLLKRQTYELDFKMQKDYMSTQHQEEAQLRKNQDAVNLLNQTYQAQVEKTNLLNATGKTAELLFDGMNTTFNTLGKVNIPQLNVALNQFNAQIAQVVATAKTMQQAPATNSGSGGGSFTQSMHVSSASAMSSAPGSDTNTILKQMLTVLQSIERKSFSNNTIYLHSNMKSVPANITKDTAYAHVKRH